MGNDFFDEYTLPVGEWIENGVDWLVVNATPVFDAIQAPIGFVLDTSEDFLLWLPWYVVILIVMAISFMKHSGKHLRKLADGEAPGKVIRGILGDGWKLALLSGGLLMFAGFLGYWELTMTTLSMILTALIFCIVVGIPLGILSASTDTAENIIRPALDAMQTILPFVYLVRIVLLFGTGAGYAGNADLCAAAYCAPDQPGYSSGAARCSGSRQGFRLQQQAVAL
jgi:glycine betaine/proline transport system permease protein